MLPTLLRQLLHLLAIVIFLPYMSPPGIIWKLAYVLHPLPHEVDPQTPQRAQHDLEGEVRIPPAHADLDSVVPDAAVGGDGVAPDGQHDEARRPRPSQVREGVKEGHVRPPDGRV